MNKKLSPLALFLISLAIFYFGGGISGALGVGLSVGGFVCFFAALVGWFNKLFGGGSIENTTRATARAMLSSFFAIHNKHKYPIKTASDKMKIYTEILKMRPGYTDAVIKEVFIQSEKLSDIWGDTQGISLNTLTFVIVMREYYLDTHKLLTEEQMEKIREIITETLLYRE